MIYEKQFHRSIAYLRQVYAGYVVHLGVMEHGTISTEGPELLTCLVDYERRHAVAQIATGSGRIDARPTS